MDNEMLYSAKANQEEIYRMQTFFHCFVRLKQKWDESYKNQFSVYENLIIIKITKVIL